MEAVSQVSPRFPTSSIFSLLWKNRNNLSCMSCHTTAFRNDNPLLSDQRLVLLEHARVSACLMWRDVFLRSAEMTLHLLFDEEKSNVYAFLFQINLWISLQCMRIQFSNKWKTKAMDSQFDASWRPLKPTKINAKCNFLKQKFQPYSYSFNPIELLVCLPTNISLFYLPAATLLLWFTAAQRWIQQQIMTGTVSW